MNAGIHKTLEYCKDLFEGNDATNDAYASIRLASTQLGKAFTMDKNIMLVVHGNVQGVSFRAFAKENADMLNIRGYVKNLKDGTVKIVVEGDDQKLQEFVEKIKAGPPEAKVDNVEIIERNYIQNFHGFEVC